MLMATKDFGWGHKFRMQLGKETLGRETEQEFRSKTTVTLEDTRVTCIFGQNKDLKIDFPLNNLSAPTFHQQWGFHHLKY